MDSTSVRISPHCLPDCSSPPVTLSLPRLSPCLPTPQAQPSLSLSAEEERKVIKCFSRSPFAPAFLLTSSPSVPRVSQGVRVYERLSSLSVCVNICEEWKGERETTVNVSAASFSFPRLLRPEARLSPFLRKLGERSRKATETRRGRQKVREEARLFGQSERQPSARRTPLLESLPFLSNIAREGEREV